MVIRMDEALEDIAVEVVEDEPTIKLAEEADEGLWLSFDIEDFADLGPLRGDGSPAREPIKERGHQGVNFGRFADQF